MFVGVLIAALGGVATGAAFAANHTVGWVALGLASSIAGTVFNIGVIGKGVEIGVRASRH